MRPILDLREDLFTYGHPEIPTNPHLREEVMEVTKLAYRDVNKTLESEGLPPLKGPIYVSAADLFPLIKEYLIIFDEKGVNVVDLPAGIGRAAYDSKNKAIIYDEGAFPHTRKNLWLRDIYKKAIDKVEKLGKLYPKLREIWNSSKEYYIGVLERLQRLPYVSAVHEVWHHYTHKEGIANDIVGEKEEGMTEKLTEETIGRPTSPNGTVYKLLRDRIDKVLNKIGIGQALKAIKKYIMGERSIAKKISQTYDSLYPTPVLE